MLVNMTVSEFLAKTKSDEPAPGGGSASALAGAVGAALAVMVANLTTGEKYAQVQEEVKALKKELEPVLAKLEKYVDEDTNAFNKVMDAYKLPKGTDEEKAVRNKAIQKAIQDAAYLPMAVAQDSLKVLELAGEMLKIGNPNAASDAAVAGRLAYAAMWGAIYNVRINLQSIKDESVTKELREKISSLLAKSETALEKLQVAADEKIGL